MKQGYLEQSTMIQLIKKFLTFCREIQGALPSLQNLAISF